MKPTVSTRVERADLRLVSLFSCSDSFNKACALRLNISNSSISVTAFKEGFLYMEQSLNLEILETIDCWQHSRACLYFPIKKYMSLINL